MCILINGNFGIQKRLKKKDKTLNVRLDFLFDWLMIYAFNSVLNILTFKRSLFKIIEPRYMKAYTFLWACFCCIWFRKVYFDLIAAIRNSHCFSLRIWYEFQKKKKKKKLQALLFNNHTLAIYVFVYNMLYTRCK